MIEEKYLHGVDFFDQLTDAERGALSGCRRREKGRAGPR